MATAKDILSRWKPDPLVCGAVAHIDEKPKMMRRRELDRERRVFFARHIISTHPVGSVGMLGFIRSLSERHGELAARMIQDDISREMTLVKYKPSEEDARLLRQSERRYAPRQEDVQDEFVVDPEVNQQGLSRMKATLNQAITSIRGRQSQAAKGQDEKLASSSTAPPSSKGFSFVVNTALRKDATRERGSAEIVPPSVKKPSFSLDLKPVSTSGSSGEPMVVPPPVVPVAMDDPLGQPVDPSGAGQSMVGFVLSDY